MLLIVLALFFTYLNERRKYNAGMLAVGQRVSHSMTIPPGASNFTISAFCPSDCMDEDGIFQSSVVFPK